MILYHGTKLKNLKRILKEGIKPRVNKPSNWEDHGKSRPDLVYLSDCYAPYYASAACKEKNERGVLIKVEIDSKKIKLYPDEEFLFNVLFKNKTDRKDIQKVYESINPRSFRLLQLQTKKEKEVIEGWKASLDYLGVVSTDFVPRKFVKGFYIEKDSLEFIYNCDPVISLLNYKVCGQQYRDYLNSLEFVKA
jgi:hypothetical protein